MDTNLKRAAMEYASKGYSIFPLGVKGKAPITAHGVKDSSNNVSVVQTWWEKKENYNIGLATGQANMLLIVDLDIDETKCLDGKESLDDWMRDNGQFPETWTVRTGRGGYHLYFRTSEPFRNRTGVLPGVDVRGESGYVVAPPSLHPNGNYYEWVEGKGPDDIPISQLNDVVRKFLAIGNNPVVEAKKLSLPNKVGKGQRNDTMFRIACSLQSKGLDDSSIYAACCEENKQRFDPPLPDNELRTILKSATERFNKGEPIFFDAAGEAIQGHHEPILARDDKNRILQTTDNCREAIEYDPELYSKIRYNCLSYAPFVVGALPWDPNPSNYREWNNFDDSSLFSYIEKKYGLKSPAKCMDALNIVVNANRFNPVTDMLESLYNTKWDGNYGHIRKLLPDYLGVEDTDYAYEVMTVFLLGAISRAYKPGCKFDYMPVLVGPQGAGKSTFLRYLSLNNNWYDDNFNTIEGNLACDKLRGKWMVEMAELLATKRAKEVESIKSFITSTCDNYRPPYQRRTEQRPRFCVFAGTTNNVQFLTDRTGNRRFLPIETHVNKPTKDIFDDNDELISEITNAWGEAMDIFMKADKNVQLVLPRNLADEIAKSQEDYLEEDPRASIIQEWLESRFGYVCVAQIIVEALGMDRRDLTRKISNEVHQIMEHSIVGWTRCRKKQRCGDYGVAVVFERTDMKTSDENDLPFDF